MPLLSTSNCFEILSNICDFETILPDVQVSKKSIPVPASIPVPKVRKSKWEKTLPKKYHIATAEQSLYSLKLKVVIETIDTSEWKSVTCLVDSSATSEFIDRDYADEPSRSLLPLTDYFAVYSTPFPLTLSRRCVRLYTHEEHFKTLLPTDQKPIRSRKDQYQRLLDSTPPTYNNRPFSHSYYFNNLYHRLLFDYPISTHFESRISDQHCQRYGYFSF